MSAETLYNQELKENSLLPTEKHNLSSRLVLILLFDTITQLFLLNLSFMYEMYLFH